MGASIGITLAAGAAFVPYTTSWLDRATSFIGIFGLFAIAWFFSENRKHVVWRPVLVGGGLSLALGGLILVPGVAIFFHGVVGKGVDRLLAFANEGAIFVFGTIMPHEILVNGQAVRVEHAISPPLQNFAFTVLPTIVFFSALMSVLYYLGVMQWIVSILAKIVTRTMGTSGAESLSAAGNIFLGQTEAPLLVSPFIAGMTRSELMTVMTGGFATVAGGVMGAYVQFLQGIPDIAGHLVMASIIATPASVAVAKLMVPETETPETSGLDALHTDKTAANVVEAAANGASAGMGLAIGVAAMLIAFVAIVHLINAGIGSLPIGLCDGFPTMSATCGTGVAAEPLSLSWLLGLTFAPIAFLMGVPTSDVMTVAQLLGEKLVLTEFVAYVHLGEMVNATTPVLTERSAIIASYALCGFANFASIGIQIGGIGGIATERRADIASLGFRAMFAGMLATCITGAVMGVFL